MALYFDIAEDKKSVAKQLNDMIIENGYKLKTGFVGTPFLLHALSQNGYTDLDDFGTVPISENYSVDTYYNSPNGSFYGLDGMNENFCRVIGAHPAYVDPMEMLCGRWRDMLVNYRGDVHYLPDWIKRNKKNMNLM